MIRQRDPIAEASMELGLFQDWNAAMGSEAPWQASPQHRQPKQIKTHWDRASSEAGCLVKQETWHACWSKHIDSSWVNFGDLSFPRKKHPCHPAFQFISTDTHGLTGVF